MGPNDLDLSALLGTIQPSPDAQLQAMRNLGLLGQLSGDKVVAPLGQGLVGQYQHAIDSQRQAAQFGQQMAKETALEKYRQQEIDARNRSLDQSDAFHRQQLDVQNQRLAAMTRAMELRGIKYNPNTGEFENVAPMVHPGNAPQAPAPSTPPAAPPNQSAPPDVVYVGHRSVPGQEAPVLSPADPASVPPLPGPSAPAPAPAKPGDPLRRSGPMAGKMLDKALKDLGSDFDPSGGRAGEFGKNMQRVNAARRVLALAEDENGNPKDLSPQFMTELFTSLAALINAGGQPAESLIRELTPFTKGRQVAQWKQWWTDNPQGADQLGFVRQAVESAKRERDVAQAAIDQTRQQRAAKHQRVLTSNPEQARNVLKPFGWDIGPDGLPVMMGPAPMASASVRVRYKGQTLDIPRSRLDEAKKDGAVEVK